MEQNTIRKRKRKYFVTFRKKDSRKTMRRAFTFLKEARDFGGEMLREGRFVQLNNLKRILLPL